MQTIQSMLRIAAVVLGLFIAAQVPLYAADAADPAPAEPLNKTREYLKDSTITAKVKEALLVNKLRGISVKTDLGVVYLTGTIASEEERQQVTKIVSAVEGVKNIESKGLQVKSSS